MEYDIIVVSGEITPAKRGLHPNTSYLTYACLLALALRSIWFYVGIPLSQTPPAAPRVLSPENVDARQLLTADEVAKLLGGPVLTGVGLPGPPDYQSRGCCAYVGEHRRLQVWVWPGRYFPATAHIQDWSVQPVPGLGEKALLCGQYWRSGVLKWGEPGHRQISGPRNIALLCVLQGNVRLDFMLHSAGEASSPATRHALCEVARRALQRL